ncbi:MAG: DUF2970 domain-containing protein [Burkholderiales bacterium]|nr:DUF2970 domain-containing protein [Burkholderiales bacterium]MDQ3197214.1 DUF2970 domain-containing protein [Pseudomonadota bacterium]
MTEAPEPAEPARKGSALQAAKAVFWAFLGVRKRKHGESDTVSLTLGQVIVAGIVGALLFVIGLVVLVSYVTR